MEIALKRDFPLTVASSHRLLELVVKGDAKYFELLSDKHPAEVDEQVAVSTLRSHLGYFFADW